VHPAALSSGSPSGSALLTVGAVVPEKGHDVLIDALAGLADLPWSCRVIGSLDRAPDFVDRLREQVRSCGLDDRVTFEGPLPRESVATAYDTSDLLALPTRLEMYGMVLTEALACGVPVLASDTGGVREAVGAATDGTVPGVLLPPDDAPSLGAALRRWLEDRTWRETLRARALSRRGSLPDWSTTARQVERVLVGAGMNRTEAANVVRT
jgi:glycosyltransferase involved in cell wall biosynthesis